GTYSRQYIMDSRRELSGCFGKPALLKRLINKLFAAPREPEARAPEARAAERRATRQWISNPWHAVSVVPCQDACQAARHSNRRRFLSSEAPTLPLTGCDSKACHCHYVHYDDRRRSVRRVVGGVSVKPRWRGAERRATRGRRSTD